MVRKIFQKKNSVQNARQLFISILQQSFIQFNLCNKKGDQAEVFDFLYDEETEYGYKMGIRLPVGITVRKVKEEIKNVGESIYCTIRVRQIEGREIELQFSSEGLPSFIEFEVSHPSDSRSLVIPFPSSFGTIQVDLAKDKHTHFLIAGATGTGKTGVLIYLLTMIMLRTKGQVQILIASGKKMSDFSSFRNIPQIQFSKSDKELEGKLGNIIKEGDRRADLMEKYCTTKISELRAILPEETFSPIFIAVDEFARYAEEEEIQDLVTEIAETYRFVDIHLILATQRPDVQTVLKSRVRANILTRIALTTADEANSKIILNVPDAAYLGGVQGRAILYDGQLNEVQVPYVDDIQCEEIMDEFRSVVYDRKRSTNYPIPEEVSSDESGPTVKTRVSRSRKSGRNDQPHLKETIKRLTHPSDSST